MAANRAEMARARAMTALFQHFSTDFQARRAEDPHFTAPPLTELITETQPVTGQSSGRIRADLEAVLLMDAHAPWLAEYVDDGRLDSTASSACQARRAPPRPPRPRRPQRRRPAHQLRADLAIELSTHPYRPTGAIWREVVAAQPTCFAPTCHRPATEGDLDHRVPWPQGTTSTGNLGPGCRRDHLAKHARGASLRKSRDGTLRYTTRAGMTHLITPTEQPGCDDADAGRLWQRLVESHPSTEELLDALHMVRRHTHEVDDLEDEARRRAGHAEDLRLSYPDATDEDITDWVWGDTAPPPLQRTRPDRFWDQPPSEPEL